jgi:transposase
MVRLSLHIVGSSGSIGREAVHEREHRRRRVAWKVESDRERIRRAFHLEHTSIRQLARDEGCSRATIRKVLATDRPSPHKSREKLKKPAPVFGPYQARVEAFIAHNDRLPRKQRYTAHRIFELLREEGYQGSESTVRHYISGYKQATTTPEVFLPLEFEPGEDAQVDWGEAYADLAGHRQKIQLFVMRLCYSRRTFAMAFPTQRQECFFWGHVCAFEHFEGVPHRISYDNLGTAVKLVFEKTGKAGRPRQEVQAFVAFRSHYLFSSHFCTPAQGHEKGQVEGGVLCRHFLNLGACHETIREHSLNASGSVAMPILIFPGFIEGRASILPPGKCLHKE